MQIPLLIGGQEVVTESKYEVPSCSPTPEVLYLVSALENVNDVDLVCNDALKGFKQWSGMKYSERKTILLKSLECLKAKRPEFEQCFKDEGLPGWFQGFNMDQMVGQVEEYISQITNSEGEVIKTETADMAITVRDPIGPVLSIAPWNAPGILIGRSIIAPLAAGCSVIAKSTELSPKVAYLLVKAFHEGGVPELALQLIHVHQKDNVEYVNRFISNSSVRKIAFTGSSATGSKIAQQAAAHLKPCLLELGGKNCTIINQDCDLPSAVGASLFASWGHNGQICMSTHKIYVHESRYEEFKQLVSEIGPNVIDESDAAIPHRISPLANLVRGLVQDALRDEAEIIYGENPELSSQNNPIGPLVLGNIKKDMRIDSQEIFGPVVSVETFSDVSGVIDLINSNQYGLKTSIWSKDVMAAVKLARSIESGGVHINAPTLYDEATAPHGGVKKSGYGRFNGKWGIEEFSYVKVITMNSGV